MFETRVFRGLKYEESKIVIPLQFLLNNHSKIEKLFGFNRNKTAFGH